MMLRPHTVLLPTGTGRTTLATVPVQGAIREQPFMQVRQELAQTELSSPERREYPALPEAAHAMQQNGDQQVCLDIVNRVQGLLTESAPATPRVASVSDAATRSRATLEQAPGLSEGADPDLADAECHRTVLAAYEDVLQIKGKSAKTQPD